MFAWLLIFLLLIVGATIAFMTYINLHPGTPESEMAMSIFLGVILGLVFFEAMIVYYWSYQFQQRLVGYVEGLNIHSRESQGVEFYFEDTGRCGKITHLLGIRKHAITSL